MARALLTAALGFSANQAAEVFLPPEIQLYEMQWQRFKHDFQRSYANDADESHRFAIFRTNIQAAYAMNEEQGVNCTCLFDDEACVFGVTKFSDLSEEEFAATRLGYRPSNDTSSFPVLEESELPLQGPRSLDWRAKGAVSAVKDQGQCGSCWAFSTAEEVESAVFMATEKLETLSTQQIISCDKKDDGCDGGDPTSAYKYLERAGLDSASDYPDRSHKTGQTGKCKWDGQAAVKVFGFQYATPPCKRGACHQASEPRLARALAAKGPMSVCVNAGGNGWQLYKQGIYSKKCSGAASELDHCVQLVGYHMSGKKPYWIVRNSWNTDWGVNGYMHLEMGKNLCGIADEATLATATLALPEDLLTV